MDQQESILTILLRNARNILEEDWAGGDGLVGMGTHCTATALGIDINDSLYKKALSILCNEIGIPVDTTEMYRWNDDPKRTHQEVLALLDKGIEVSLNMQ